MKGTVSIVYGVPNLMTNSGFDLPSIDRDSIRSSGYCPKIYFEYACKAFIHEVEMSNFLYDQPALWSDCFPSRIEFIRTVGWPALRAEGGFQFLDQAISWCPCDDATVREKIFMDCDSAVWFLELIGGPKYNGPFPRFAQYFSVDQTDAGLSPTLVGKEDWVMRCVHRIQRCYSAAGFDVNVRMAQDVRFEQICSNVGTGFGVPLSTDQLDSLREQ